MSDHQFPQQVDKVDLPVYGIGDSTYQAVGKLEGITRLVNRFYDLMDSLPEATGLRAMHTQDLAESRKKLIFFLSGWMGGPKLFAENYGPISIPKAHEHLPIDESGVKAWLHCMDQSLIDLEYPESLRRYLVQKLSIPAESIRLMCEFRRSNSPQETDNE